MKPGANPRYYYDHHAKRVLCWWSSETRPMPDNTYRTFHVLSALLDPHEIRYRMEDLDFSHNCEQITEMEVLARSAQG